jgi:hypothetical protein
MENKKRIVSTVIIGIFLAISIYCVIILFTFNLKESLQRLSDSATNRAEGQPGAVVAVGFAAGLAGAALVIMAYLFAIVALVNSSISIIFSIKNRKSYLKPVRIINYVYDGLLGFIIIFTIVKMILFATGVA